MDLKLKPRGNIETKKNKKTKNQHKFLPDNYYSYDIHKHLKTDFHNILTSIFNFKF